VDPWNEPALTLALALVAGMTAQALARHLRMPGIVLLLAAGILLGPDGAGVVRPGTLGGALHTLVGYAVAVVLFEGGMNLDLGRLRREARSIRQLVLVGSVVTAVAAALAARATLGWSWAVAALFGTLVMVTGPTVITPLLRRIKVVPRVATLLEAEGVLVDAIGAIVAVVALEVVIGVPGQPWAFAVWQVGFRLLSGAVVGAAGGALLALLLRRERLLPEGLESVFALSLVLALFQVADALVAETGIVAVVVAGLVVGNSGGHVVAELREFKEQLATLFVSLLFVLLAADVRLAEVTRLGGGAVALLLLLMFVVRPLNVLLGTWGTDLHRREKAFAAWLAPRGIVAAAVSSLFADRLEAAGMAGGTELRAMVFLVIAGTVVVQGLSGGIVAGWLGVRRPSNDGYVVVGAGAVGRALATALEQGGERVVVLDTSPMACRVAAAAGLTVIEGNALDPGVAAAAELDTRAGCLAVTTNEELNLLFARRARKDWKVPLAWVALTAGETSIGSEGAARLSARVLFAAPQRLGTWNDRLEGGEAALGWWRPPAGGPAPVPSTEQALPLLVRRGNGIAVVDEQLRPQAGDALLLAVTADGATGLVERGWRAADLATGL
jgi:NhaP-type Na+/H+ or K+/H+ antiporter